MSFAGSCFIGAALRTARMGLDAIDGLGGAGRGMGGVTRSLPQNRCVPFTTPFLCAFPADFGALFEWFCFVFNGMPLNRSSSLLHSELDGLMVHDRDKGIGITRTLLGESLTASNTLGILVNRRLFMRDGKENEEEEQPQARCAESN